MQLLASRGRMLILVVFAVLSACSSAADLQQYVGLFPSLIVFGDSILDVGINNYIPTIARANFPPYGRDWPNHKATGRFSNDRIAIDFIAQGFGLPFPLPYLDPAAAGSNITAGINFASAASGYLDDTRKVLNVIPLSGQLNLYPGYLKKLEGVVGQVNATSIIPKALFVLSTGANELLDYYPNPALQVLQPRPKYYKLIIKSLQNFVQTIYRSGGRTIAVTGLPPVGCLPAQVTVFGGLNPGKCVDAQNKDSRDVNELIRKEVESLGSKLPGLELIYLDIYTVLEDAAQNPGNYGLEEGTRGCCGTGRLEASILCTELSLGTCKNASTHVFWDAYHPSDAMNKIISEDLFAKGFKHLIKT